ncbi:MAG: 23S rRNA (pseudouridine(1915)-N(3))-methyltransferase RlmH [Lachnospiraceae bacterium]|nr:23S rRNA (pseudouridine(1915)-N(3))-methyltransferase RlmH [Lachnospiraceae bacterium]
MHTDILCVGRVKESFYRDAAAEYIKRLGAYTKLSIREVKDEKTPDKASEAETERILKLEGDRLKEGLDERALWLALAIEGKAYDSEGFAKLIGDAEGRGISRIQFIIGGSLGLAEEIKKKSTCISFSQLTFPHQLMRVILLEQLYRAQKILHGEPYHK